MLALAAALLCMAEMNAGAREWFVSLHGSDANDGAVERPLATIQKACELAQAGDIVTVRGGTYFISDQVRPRHSGTADNWILYRAMPGEKVIIDGSHLTHVYRDGKAIAFSSLHEGLVQIENVSYVKFKDINVRNSYAAGFILRGGSEDVFDPERESPTKEIILENCTSHNSFNSGIGVWYSDNVLVSGCEITGANNIDFRVRSVKPGHEAPHEAISVCGARHFEISHNLVHDCYKEGIDCKEVSRFGKVHHNKVWNMPRQAYYVDAWFGTLENIELYDNVAHDVFWGFAISCEGEGADLHDIWFHHNVIYNTTASGFLFGMWGGNNLRENIYIYNNTFYHCGSPEIFSGGVGSIDILSQNFKNVYIYRNICDKGWDYEFGFNEKPELIAKNLKEKNFVAKENLVECTKSRLSRKGQFDAMLVEYLPKGNLLGTVIYRNEREYDLTPLQSPKVKKEQVKWKYAPSDWYGALPPVGYFE